MKNTLAALTAALLAAVSQPAAAATFSATGTTSTDLDSAIAAFNAAIGSGAATVNWDDAPDTPGPGADPLPDDTYNGAGLQLTAIGAATGFSTSDTSFGFPGDFVAYSSPRLMTVEGGSIFDISFVSGGAAATTSAFGMIFSDLETDNFASLQFFDALGSLLFEDIVDPFATPSRTGQGGLSFFGRSFDDPVLSRVRVTLGATAVSTGGGVNNSVDGVVFDDFFFGTPQVPVTPDPDPVAPIPLPAGLPLVLAGLGALSLLGRKTRV